MAARLVPAVACVALEDSVKGGRAGPAAGIRCIAVPERWPVTDARFGKAHAVMRSLLEVDPDLLGRVAAG